MEMGSSEQRTSRAPRWLEVHPQRYPLGLVEEAHSDRDGALTFVCVVHLVASHADDAPPGMVTAPTMAMSDTRVAVARLTDSSRTLVQTASPPSPTSTASARDET